MVDACGMGMDSRVSVLGGGTVMDGAKRGAGNASQTAALSTPTTATPDVIFAHNVGPPGRRNLGKVSDGTVNLGHRNARQCGGTGFPF